MNTQKIIASFLSPYNKQSQFLKDFRLIGEKGIGIFEPNSDFYCINHQPVHHFTAVELQICLNQLLYTYFGHLGLFKQIDDNEEYIKHLNANNFIIEQSTHFKKVIDVSHPIQGEINICYKRVVGNSLYIECKFSFEGSCYGKVKSILKMEDK
jgi:hypothetical protein